MRGNLHDISDQSGLMSVVTKRSTPVAEFAEIAETVFGAVREATEGRPRPVHVEIPLDVLAETGAFEAPSLASGYRPAPTREQVAAGGGAAGERDQAADLRRRRRARRQRGRSRELAELLGAPVICSIMGKGVVAEDHPYGLGHAWDPWGREPGR